MSTDPPPFDIYGELPSGTTVLEASAGTGKTYTIAALTARVVAEGAVELSQLLLVTFGRMATNELRLRVRERLVSVEASLAEAVGQREPSEPLGQLEAMMCTGESEELARRYARWPTSTPRPLRPHTSSACRCSTASGCLAIESGMPPSLST
jgi:exodeoxyribonuclease V beta subunit